MPPRSRGEPGAGFGSRGSPRRARAVPPDEEHVEDGRRLPRQRADVPDEIPPRRARDGRETHARGARDPRMKGGSWDAILRRRFLREAQRP
jgi:hypothetical protein